MKILVTGSTGFVGTHLCKRLHEDGHQVYALARNKNKFKIKNVQGQCIIGKLTSSSASSDWPWLNQLPKDLDAVIHTAGLVHSHRSTDFYEINAHASHIFFENLGKRYDKLKIILISSQAAAGPSNHNQKRVEQDVESPVSHYGKSKLMAENYLKQYSKPNWHKTIIRPPMVIGPQDDAFLDIFKMIKSGFFFMPGRRSYKAKFSFICIHDLTQAISLALNKEEKQNIDIYFTGHDQIISFEQLIDTIANIIGQARLKKITIPILTIKFIARITNIFARFGLINLRITPDKVNEIKQTNWTFDNIKSKKQLGMYYQWNLSKTLKTTYRDYLKSGKL